MSRRGSTGSKLEKRTWTGCLKEMDKRYKIPTNLGLLLTIIFLKAFYLGVITGLTSLSLVEAQGTRSMYLRHP